MVLTTTEENYKLMKELKNKYTAAMMESVKKF